MTSIALSRVPPLPGSPRLWFSATKTNGPPAVLPDGSNGPAGDWHDPALVAAPQLFYVSGESNAPSEMGEDWVSLARAARARWFRENPF
jgi:hypothetical protein